MEKKPTKRPLATTKKEKSPATQCKKVNGHVAIKYYRGLMSKDEERSLEKHCQECNICAETMAVAKVAWDKSGQEAAKIPNAPLTAAMHGVLDRHFGRPLEQYPFQWAASDKPQGSSGQSKGVAVAVGDDRGAVINCSAWVGKRELTAGKFEIWGQQIKSLPEGVEIEEPLNYLEDKLSKGLFRICPELKAYNLDRRVINVDIQERIIARANSLSLAIVMAILNAIQPRAAKEAADVIYSAGLAPDGRLEAVGNIKQKIEAGKAAGVSHFVFPRANVSDIPEDAETEILIFDTLQEVLLHFGLLKINEPIGASQEMPPSQILATVGNKGSDPATDIAAVVNKLQPNSSNNEDLTHLLGALEDLCQTGGFQDNLSATFLYGDSEKVCTVLPPSPLSFVEGCTVFNIHGRMENIANILDGDRLGMVLSVDGTIKAIRRIDIQMTGRQDISPLLSGQRHRFALLSLLTGAAVLSIPLAGNRLHVYSGGNLIARYQSGRWIPMDYNTAAETLYKFTQETSLHWETVKKVLKSAISMAELELGGTFAFLKEPPTSGKLWESHLENRFGLRFSPVSVAELTEPDIIDLAKNEGAVLIDHQGIMIHCHVFFNTRLQWDGGLSERHQHARQFSRANNALVITVSRDGTVIAYIEGDIAICL